LSPRRSCSAPDLPVGIDRLRRRVRRAQSLLHDRGYVAPGYPPVSPVLFLGAFPERISTRIQQVTPLAGMAIQSTTDRMLAPFDGRSGMPIGPWEGLGVAFAWALAALAVCYALLRARDA
jgi:hypothetical protein